jgi:hypothetical protein
MNPLMSVLTDLAPAHDTELIEGCQRYAGMLEELLTPEQLATYAELVQRTSAVLILEDLSPEQMAAFTPHELAVVTNIISDESAPMENRRVAALFSQREPTAAVPAMATPQSEAQVGG